MELESKHMGVAQYTSPGLSTIAGQLRQHQRRSTFRLKETHEDKPDQSIPNEESRAAWAWLLAKDYEADPLSYTRCGPPMWILAVITNP